jgi:hypothetical protein
MNYALKEHNSYYVRQQYYPHNMESWEKEHNEMEQEYRTQIAEMIKTRVKFEMEETHRENELEAARALVLLNKRSVQKRKRDERNKSVENVNTVVRRSTRIANKK